MRFSSITAIAALSAVAYAQDSAQWASLSSDVAAYVTSSLLADPSFPSFLSAAEADSYIGELEALTGSIEFITAPSQVSSLLAAVPTNIKPFVTSILGVYSSLAIKDGVITATGSAGSAATAATGSSASSSSSAAKASATGNGANQIVETGIMAGSLMSLMGVVGLMIAL